jgi:hypothetical protein
VGHVGVEHDPGISFVRDHVVHMAHRHQVILHMNTDMNADMNKSVRYLC